MFDEDIYEASRKFVDPSLVSVAVGNKLTDLVSILKNQLSVFRESKFNVLEARHLIEDTLENFDLETGLDVSTVFDKLEREFRSKVTDAASAVEFVTNNILVHVSKDAKQYSKQLPTIKVSIVKNSLELEIKRYLQVQSKTKAFEPSSEIQETIKGLVSSSQPISARVLEDLAAKCQIKSILPLIAYIHAVQNDKAHLFVNQFETRTFGPFAPCEGPTNLSKIRKAKQEPTQLSRVLLATGTGILVPRKAESAIEFTQVPETLAQQIACLPGLDVDDTVTQAFIANSKLRTGAIVCIKLDTLSCRRVSVFDLECDDERGLNYITSERDAQGNLVLYWGFYENGKAVFLNHACFKEANLLKTTKKLQFEDFADPIDRLHLELDKARFDFRDHGNVLGFHVERPKETSIKQNQNEIAKIASEPVSVFGQPLCFVVASQQRTVSLYRVVNGHASLDSTVDTLQTSAITDITVF